MGKHELLFSPQGFIIEYAEGTIRAKLCENVYCKYDCATSYSDDSTRTNSFTSHTSCEAIKSYRGPFADNKFYKSLDEMISDKNDNFSKLNLYKSNLYNEIVIKNISKEDVKFLYISAYKVPQSRETDIFFIGYQNLYENLKNIRDAQQYFHKTFSIIFPIVFYHNQENKLIIISKNLINIKDFPYVEQNSSIGYIKKDSLLVIGGEKIHELLDKKLHYLLCTKNIAGSPSYYYQYDDFDYIYNLDFTSNTFDITNEMAAKYNINKNEYSKIKSSEIKNFLAKPFVFSNTIYEVINNPDPDGEEWIPNPYYTPETIETERQNQQKEWDEQRKKYLEEDSKKTFEEYQNILRKIYMENMVDSDKIKKDISEIKILLTLHAIKTFTTLTDEAKKEIEKLKDTKYYSLFSPNVPPNLVAEDILYNKCKEFNLSVLDFIKNIVIST